MKYQKTISSYIADFIGGYDSLERPLYQRTPLPTSITNVLKRYNNIRDRGKENDIVVFHKTPTVPRARIALPRVAEKQIVTVLSSSQHNYSDIQAGSIELTPDARSHQLFSLDDIKSFIEDICHFKYFNGDGIADLIWYNKRWFINKYTLDIDDISETETDITYRIEIYTAHSDREDEWNTGKLVLRFDKNLGTDEIYYTLDTIAIFDDIADADYTSKLTVYSKPQLLDLEGPWCYTVDLTGPRSFYVTLAHDVNIPEAGIEGAFVFSIEYEDDTDTEATSEVPTVKSYTFALDESVHNALIMAFSGKREMLSELFEREIVSSSHQFFTFSF